MKYPKNKELFKELIPFTKNIVSILQGKGVSCVIYGSFAHFTFTGDNNMKVNDIDLLIQRKNFGKVQEALKKEGIKFKYYPEWETLIIKKGKLKVEVDAVGKGYKLLTDSNLLRSTRKVDFYGMEVKMITLRQLKEMYPVAYGRTRDDKAKIKKKIRHLEKFLGEKLI